MYTNGIWKKNSHAHVFLPEASTGFVVIDNSRFKLAPFIGISSAFITPTDYDRNIQPSLQNADMGFSRTYTFGVNGDINLDKTKLRSTTTRAKRNPWFARVRYAYNMPQFALHYPGVTGNFHYITIGIGTFEKRTKRKY